MDENKKSIDLRDLIKSGVQFGHQTWRWNPKMAPYIWGQKNGIHLIDVSKTKYQLQKAEKFIESLVAEGKSILFCGTKKSAKKAIEKVAFDTKSPVVVHRWIGGTLTNPVQIRKAVTKLLHLKDIVAKAHQSFHTKKELSVFNKQIERLEKNVGGLAKLIWPVGALVIVDVKKEHVAVSEARSMGVPIVALVDTNSDPSEISYVIPTNDDAPRAVECIINELAQAVIRGKKAATPVKETVVDALAEAPNIDEVLAKALGSLDEESTNKGKAKPAPRGPIRRSPKK